MKPVKQNRVVHTEIDLSHTFKDPFSTQSDDEEPRHFNTLFILPAILWLWVAIGCVSTNAEPKDGGQTAFRVRSDFDLALNANNGWSGGINENVPIVADQPFRIRFAVEIPAYVRSGPYRLQYRRNAGEWVNTEAHDFPHPLRELALDLGSVKPDQSPQEWTTVSGSTSSLVVAEEGTEKMLRAITNEESLISIYTSPWEMTEIAAELHLPSANKTGSGLIFNYENPNNYCKLSLDPTAGYLRASRFIDGKETAVHEQRTTIPTGSWLPVEVDLEDGEAVINFANDTLEFSADLGAYRSTSKFGIHVPAGNQAEFRDFAISGEAETPRVSIISCSGFENGVETTALLTGSAGRFRPGSGVALAKATISTTTGGGISEYEWALVVRRFADGAVLNEDGDTFEFRMVVANGNPLESYSNPTLQLTVSPRHLGGTFVETPGRIGPFSASNGDLYFIMEPTETDNLFMVVKSSDNGLNWKEVDGANRPKTGDLEAVDVHQVGGTLHMVHQVTESVQYHAFRTSDHPTLPDSWDTTDEVAAIAESVAQAATFEVRSDGSMVTVYVGDTIQYSIRSTEGIWEVPIIIEPGATPAAGPKTVLGPNDTVHLAYYRTDGSIGYRKILADGTLTQERLLASGAGTSRAEYGAVLPLLYIPETDTVVILYRLADGYLWERRIDSDGRLSTPVKVSDRTIITDAVDSQQAGADAVVNKSTVHVLFIDEETRSIYRTHNSDGWQPAEVVIEDILGSWVRGNIYQRSDGKRVYGFVYDAGSEGGAGKNRFAEIHLDNF